MTTVRSVGGIPVNAVNLRQTSNVINFRAQSKSEEEQVDTFIKQQEKAHKDAKKQQIFSNTVLLLIAAASIASIGVLGHQAGWFKKFKLNFKDLVKSKSLEEMALPQTQRDMAEQIINRIEHYDEILKKGAEEGTAFLMYGPPGTGKNTFAEAIAKRFKDAKFLEIDIDKLNSMWHGESQKNILGTMDKAVKYAQKHPEEKIFVFIDEIDSVMMQDLSSGAKLSNDILNSFKKGFNSLTKQKNIIVMGATNVGVNPKTGEVVVKKLDKAMLDRFAEVVPVDLPDKASLLEGIKKFYEKPSRTMVDAAVKNIADPRWDKIAEFLSQKERETSFRKLEKILGTAGEKSTIGENLTFDDIIKSIRIQKDKLNATDADIDALVKALNSVKG